MKNSILIFLLSCIFVSCNDQVKTKFKDYKIAEENKFFEKGWIPKNLIYESMTNIYLQNNLDLNSAFFSYNLSSPDLDNLKTKIKKTSFDYRNPKRVNVPNELSNKLSKSEIFYIFENGDTTYISIEKESKKVFGWKYGK